MSKCSKCGEEGKFIGDYYNLSIIKGAFICRDGCSGKIYKVNNTGGTTYFEQGLGKKINTKDIDKICKEKGWVYGGEDLTMEATKNKAHNETRIKEQFKDGLQQELRRHGF